MGDSIHYSRRASAGMGACQSAKAQGRGDEADGTLANSEPQGLETKWQPPPEDPPTKKEDAFMEPIDSDAPLSSRAGGYRPSKDELEMLDPVSESSKGLCPLTICAAIDFTLGPRMSVRKLVDQLRDDILIC